MKNVTLKNDTNKDSELIMAKINIGYLDHFFPRIHNMDEITLATRWKMPIATNAENRPLSV